MYLVASLLVAVIALPFLLEATRTPMGEAVRADAPGQFARLSQGTTHYQWFGPEDGPVLICIHGLTTPSFVWRKLTDGLTALGFRVLTYDLYGRGYSDRPKGKQTVQFFSDQLDDLLAHEGLSNARVSLLGYSMGGAIAATYAARNRTRIDRVILLAPAGMGHLPTGPLLRAVRSVPVFGDWLMLAVYPWVFRAGLAQDADPEITPLQEREMTRRGFIAAVLSSLRGILSRGHRKSHATLARKGVPVLAIWGADDTVIPIACRDTLALWNPDAVQSVVSGAGHALPYSHADAVIGEIAEFTDA